MFRIIILLICNFAFSNNIKDLVWLTFEDTDTSRSITVNFQSFGEHSSSYVYFGEASGNYTSQSSGRTKKIEGLDRTYHAIKLENLQPNTEYFFIAGSEEIGYTKEYKFISLPNDDTPIKFITGGDLGVSQLVADTPRPALENRPHVILLGGDLSYANGKPKNFQRWDDWFELMKYVFNSQDGYLIPMIVAVGNHEVNTGISFPWSKAPFYSALFEQGGSSYFTRELGNHTALLILDTGHLKPMVSQVGFIKRQLKKYADWSHRIAIYHAPLYPNHRSFLDPLSSLARTYWLPEFDKGNLTLGIENHDHTMKRTKVLRNNKISQKGTIYIGDGCWGKGARESHPEKWYLEKALSKSHVWYVETTPQALNINASGHDSDLLDEFSLSNSRTHTHVSK